MSGRLVIAAPAKVNLALAVAPARASDGYHPISSWFAPISLADEVRLERLGEGESSRHGVRWADDAVRATAIDWPVEKDLAVRAHRLLEGEAGRALPLAMEVVKRTPVGAGLGGGSSDGGAALVGVRRLFGLGVSDERLCALGASLGADVPFFLPPSEGRPALVEGLGERLTRTMAIRSATGGAQRLLLVTPPFGCPTGAVYKAYDAAPNARFEESASRVRAMAARPFVQDDELFNDLAEPAMRVRPALREIKERIEAITRGRCHVTGSGSGLFVVLDEDADMCGRLARGVEETLEGVRVRVVEVG